MVLRNICFWSWHDLRCGKLGSGVTKLGLIIVVIFNLGVVIIRVWLRLRFRFIVFLLYGSRRNSCRLSCFGHSGWWKRRLLSNRRLFSSCQSCILVGAWRRSFILQKFDLWVMPILFPSFVSRKGCFLTYRKTFAGFFISYGWLLQTWNQRLCRFRFAYIFAWLFAQILW